MTTSELVVVLSGIALIAALAAFGSTTMDLTIDEPGEYSWACGMNMLHGTLVAEAPDGDGGLWETAEHGQTPLSSPEQGGDEVVEAGSGMTQGNRETARAVGVGPRVDDVSTCERAEFLLRGGVAQPAHRRRLRPRCRPAQPRHVTAAPRDRAGSLRSAPGAGRNVGRRVAAISGSAVTRPSGLHGYPVLRSCAFSLVAAGSWWALRHQRSQAVARWAPGGGRPRRAGPLHVRVLGSGEQVVLLLHGLAGAGNGFGAAYDELAQAATVVVPDLLGFGGSMDATGPTDAQAHIAALDAALAALGLQDRPTVVAGHSLGGVLAIRWAAAHSHRVRAVLTFGAPLYVNRAEADAHIGAIGRMEALLAGDGPLPRAACAWMCRHRNVAAWLAVAYRPDLPVPVARSGVKHTWSTYSSAMDGLIRDDGWLPALVGLTRVPLTLAAGACDPVPVPGRAAELARTRPALRSVAYPEADHGLPLTHPDWCRQLIAEALRIEPR